MILKNHTSAPIRKEKLSPTNKPRREGRRNEFVEKAGCQTESKAFEKSIVERIVRDPGQGLFNPFKWIKKGTEFYQEQTVQGRNRPGGKREWN